MATEIVQAHPCADRQGQTAPLNPAAEAALAKVERGFLPLPLVRAVTRHEVASARTAELSHLMDVRDLSVPERHDFDASQDLMRDARATLAKAGRLDLIETAS
ncbi:hypothetical protein [Streptomyces sp. NPDC003832]